MKTVLRIAAASLILTMSACQTFTLAPAGKPVVVAKKLEITPTIDWSKVKYRGMDVWTVDGPPLDMVKFYTDLEDGDSLEMIIDAPTNKDDAPAFRKSMTNLEIAELIKNSYINAGRQQFAISSMKPAMFANKKGIRVDFSYKTKKGLDKRGFAVGAIFDDKLNLAIYTGTEEYYFPKYKYEVEKMLMALEHIENKS